jgi:diacylglycerol kinase family enzyme
VKVNLVCNPASGGSTDGEAIERLLERHGATLVDEDGAERVVVSGGDGTVAQGAELAARLGVPLAVIPTGTANDFARATGIPRDEEAAAELAVTGPPGPAHDLARMDGRPFVNVAAAGLAPAAARRAEPLKRFLGPLAYTAGAAAAGVLEQPIACTIDPHFAGRAWQVIVAGTGAFGGGAEIDAADPADGRLDLVVLPAGPRVALVRYAAGMRRGTLAEAPGAIHARADAFTIDLPTGTSFNVDGEVVEASGRVRFTVEAGAFRLVQPSE